ncbi:MAG: metal ABC transporter permease [Candidatus Kapabacteria bacterium]|nr:metal ABC transporter permease [Candidatus Kapabacteria bacterium]MDW7997334.1 metal ABC transporter permease [Bacteroidota bacterium]
MENLAIVVTATLLSSVCALLGNFLLLRRMALLGDVVSHAVLPGIVLGYLWSGVYELPVVLLGAMFSAAVALLIVQLLQHRFGWHSDTALAAVLSSFFATGVLLLSAFGGNIDLDVECVLYGEIAYVPLDVTTLPGLGIPVSRAVLISLGLLVVVAAVIAIAYKELVLTAFDPEFAATAGISPQVWQTVLLILTAVVTVVGFELVGAILIVALLVVPAATARLVTARLPAMLGVSVLLGIGGAVGGYAMASVLQGAIAGWMAIAAGVQFLVVFAWRRVRQRFWVTAVPSDAARSIR